MDDTEQHFQKEQDQMSRLNINVEIVHFSPQVSPQPPSPCPKFTKFVILKQP